MELPKKLTDDPAKDDILHCLLQLAERCEELGYRDLESTLCIVATADIHGLGEDLADCVGAYAQVAMPDITEMVTDQEEYPDDEEDEEKPKS